MDCIKEPPANTAHRGGLIRDEKGEWIAIRFRVTLGHTSILDAELGAILEGIKLAADLKITNLLVESDSQEAVYIIAKRKQNLTSTVHSIHGVDIPKLEYRDSSCVCAEKLVRSASSYCQSLQILKDSLEGLQFWLERNLGSDCVPKDVV